MGLCGNKSDLKDDHKITEDQAQAFAKEHDIDHFNMTSAKTDEGIVEIFDKICHQLYTDKDKIADQN